MLEPAEPFPTTPWAYRGFVDACLSQGGRARRLIKPALTQHSATCTQMPREVWCAVMGASCRTRCARVQSRTPHDRLFRGVKH